MALTYNQITAITEKKFLSQLADNIFNSNAVLARLYRPEKLSLKDGGTKIVAPIINTKAGLGGSFDDLDELNTSRSDNITAAEFDWKQYYEPIRISRKEMLQNNGDAAKLSLIASKMKVAEKSFRDNLGTGMFSDGTGNDSKDITGFQAMISSSSTYGGIAVADFAGWIAQIKQGSTPGTDEALTLARMQQAYGAASEDNDTPTMITCKQDVYDQLWSLYQPHQRLISEEMSDLGFENILTFNGVPVIVDSHMKAGSMYFINEDYAFLCVHREENMRKETIERLETSNSMLMRVFWMGNLVCNNRRFQAELDDISVAS